MLGCQPSTLTHRSMHHQKSSSDSPFHANTLNPGRQKRLFYAPRGRKMAGCTHTHTLTSLCQSRCHFILGGVDVAGRPSALSPQSRQGLHQHLTGAEGPTELGQEEQRSRFTRVCSHSLQSGP